MCPKTQSYQVAALNLGLSDPEPDSVPLTMDVPSRCMLSSKNSNYKKPRRDRGLLPGVSILLGGRKIHFTLKAYSYSMA